MHTLADFNLLLELGVSCNVMLFPHGASLGKGSSPRVRDLSDRSCNPIIGCHGFFLPGKGIEQLIRSCARLRKYWPGLRLRLVNARFPVDISEFEIERCRRLAEDLGFSDSIEWHTEFLPLDQATKLLSACDLIVMAYEERTDSASGAVRVALSSLAPVMVTDVGIFEELGDAVGRTGTNDPVKMSTDIKALLASLDRRRRLQANAVAWLAAHEWSAVGARLEGMIQGLVEQASFADMPSVAAFGDGQRTAAA